MIITIGRQHGSGGHDIARALAKKLQISCYGKEIVDEAAKGSNFSREVVDSFDEKRAWPPSLRTNRIFSASTTASV